MKSFAWALSLAITPFLTSAVHAQSGPTDKASIRAERKAQGTEATREFKSAEGDPKPASMSKSSKVERDAARQARKAVGAQAAREFQPGEGDPMPTASAKVPRSERTAARKARTSEVAAENKAGRLPSYGENWSGK